MLGRDPLQNQLAAAARTASRQPNRHHPVDPPGWLAVRVPAVGRAGLAPGTPGIRRGVLPGERGGLALAGPAQRLHLGTQALVGLPESLTLGPQPLAFGLQAPLLVLQQLLLLAQGGVLVLQAGDALLQRRRASQVPDGAPTHGHHRHKTRRLQPAHPPSKTRYLNTVQLTMTITAWSSSGRPQASRGMPSRARRRLANCTRARRRTVKVVE
jgi:hypothetical protein